MVFEAKSISKSYGKKTPLTDISFTVKSNECVGILGRNGTGKSTLLSVLAGVRKCGSGKFTADGKDLFGDKKLLSASVGYIPQGTPLMEELSAKDNLLLWYDKKTLEREMASGVLSLLGINEFAHTVVSKLSGGMKKRLSIGCALAGAPSLLLLDEPCAALDIVCREEVLEYLKLYKERGGAVVIATHDERDLLLCDKTYVLKNGVLNPVEYTGDIAMLAKEL